MAGTAVVFAGGAVWREMKWSRKMKWENEENESRENERNLYVLRSSARYVWRPAKHFVILFKMVK